MKVNLLVGNIGSGKSTIARKLMNLEGGVIVNMDSLQQSIHGGEYDRYDNNLKQVYNATEESIIESALKEGRNVHIDRTNMDAKRRKRFIDLAMQYTNNIVCYDFGPGDDVFLMRRQKQNRGIMPTQWKKVFDFMKSSYGKPAIEEGFSSIVTPPKKFKIHAFDFDGTIVKNEYPNIGSENKQVSEMINGLYKSLENVIIVWTCRYGNDLDAIRSFMREKQIHFDFINENPLFETGSRKIFAHKYYDDRNEPLPEDTIK